MCDFRLNKSVFFKQVALPSEEVVDAPMTEAQEEFDLEFNRLMGLFDGSEHAEDGAFQFDIGPIKVDEAPSKEDVESSRNQHRARYDLYRVISHKSYDGTPPNVREKAIDALIWSFDSGPRPIQRDLDTLLSQFMTYFDDCAPLPNQNDFNALSSQFMTHFDELPRKEVSRLIWFFETFVDDPGLRHKN